MSAIAPVGPSAVSKTAALARQTYTLAEFAALLGVSYTQLHECAQRGALPVAPIRQGRKYLFPRSAVHNLLGMTD